MIHCSFHCLTSLFILIRDFTVIFKPPYNISLFHSSLRTAQLYAQKLNFGRPRVGAQVEDVVSALQTELSGAHRGMGADTMWRRVKFDHKLPVTGYN